MRETLALEGGESATIDSTDHFCVYRIEGLVRILRRHWVHRDQGWTVCGVDLGPKFARADQVPGDAWGCEEHPCERCVRGLTDVPR